MAIIEQMDPKAFSVWRDSRPQAVREMIDRWPPNRLYQMASTGHRCTIYSYSEDGTVTVLVTGEYNILEFARKVFGIDPNDLTECDLPAPGEVTGALLTTEEQIAQHIKTFKAKRTG